MIYINLRAHCSADGYVVNGRKVWISTAQVTEKMLLLARTTPLEDVKKPTDGLSLFYTNLDRPYVDVKEIEKLGRKAVDSNELFIDNLPIPQEDLIGEEGQGFKACETAVLTHGGFGYAKEYHVERYFREAMLLRIAPISTQLIMCYIAEKVLGLPKSY